MEGIYNLRRTIYTINTRKSLSEIALQGLATINVTVQCCSLDFALGHTVETGLHRIPAGIRLWRIVSKNNWELYDGFSWQMHERSCSGRERALGSLHPRMRWQAASLLGELTASTLWSLPFMWLYMIIYIYFIIHYAVSICNCPVSCVPMCWWQYLTMFLHICIYYFCWHIQALSMF